MEGELGTIVNTGRREGSILMMVLRDAFDRVPLST
jgi:hypothetical protein